MYRNHLAPKPATPRRARAGAPVRQPAKHQSTAPKPTPQRREVQHTPHKYDALTIPDRSRYAPSLSDTAKAKAKQKAASSSRGGVVTAMDKHRARSGRFSFDDYSEDAFEKMFKYKKQPSAPLPRTHSHRAQAYRQRFDELKQRNISQRTSRRSVSEDSPSLSELRQKANIQRSLQRSSQQQRQRSSSSSSSSQYTRSQTPRRDTTTSQKQYQQQYQQQHSQPLTRTQSIFNKNLQRRLESAQNIAASSPSSSSLSTLNRVSSILFSPVTSMVSLLSSPFRTSSVLYKDKNDNRTTGLKTPRKVMATTDKPKKEKTSEDKDQRTLDRLEREKKKNEVRQQQLKRSQERKTKEDALRVGKLDKIASQVEERRVLHQILSEKELAELARHEKELAQAEEADKLTRAERAQLSTGPNSI